MFEQPVHSKAHTTSPVLCGVVLCRAVLCCAVTPTHSYLGYGLMAARAKVIEAGKDDPNHPCFAKGSSLKYSYAGVCIGPRGRQQGRAGQGSRRV